MTAKKDTEGSLLFDRSFRIRSDYAGQLLSCAHCGTPFFRKRKDIKQNVAPTCSKSCSSSLVRAVWAEHGISPRTFWQPGSAESQADACRGPKSHFYKDGIMSRRRAGHYRFAPNIPCMPGFETMACPKGRVGEHRMMVALAIGRPLTSAENVHHVNGDTWDNSPENLMLFASVSDHLRFEWHGEPEPLWHGSDADADARAELDAWMHKRMPSRRRATA